MRFHRSTLGSRYIPAALSQGRSAKTPAGELAVLRHGRYSFYRCVYVNFFLLWILRLFNHHLNSLAAPAMDNACRPDAERL